MNGQTLQSLYARHRKALLALAVSTTGDAARAEDAVHDAFERLCRTGLHHADDPTAYVFAAVRRAAIDCVRRGRHAAGSPGLSCSLFAEPSPEPVNHVLAAERDRLVADSVNALPPEQREVVVLRIFANLSFAQIAQVVGAPLPTVATRYRRALARLRERLEKLV